jgi:hypothetical protein
MSRDPMLEHGAARNEALLAPGPKGRCTCGEDRDAAMIWAGKCYRCHRRQIGLPEFEEHHWRGRRHPDDTVDLPVNEHRVIDALRQARHPLLIQPTGDPLVDVDGLMMQLVELAEMTTAAAERRQVPQWKGRFAEILAQEGREAAERLLSLSVERRK